MTLPKRIQRNLVRRSLPFIFQPNCSLVLTRLGSRFGGWTVPLSWLNTDSVCYSFGVGEDLTFDLELVARIGCHVHVFDPTPRSRRHFDMLNAAAQDNQSAIGQLKPVYGERCFKAISNLSFHEIGVWSDDRELDFYEPANPQHVSHSVTNLQHTEIGFSATVKSVRSIATLLGHKQIDLLKMDVEGAEMAAIGSLLAQGPLPNCLCVEFDAAAQGRMKDIKRLHDLIQKMKAAGYSVAHIEDWNFLFVR